IEPCRLAVGDKELLPRRGVFPAHLAWLLDPQHSSFTALDAAARINFSEIRAQALHAVVTRIDGRRRLPYTLTTTLAQQRRTIQQQEQQNSRLQLLHLSKFFTTLNPSSPGMSPAFFP